MSLNFEEVMENNKIYQQRIKLFKEFGYDVDEERDVIFEQAQPINGSILEIGTGKGHFAIALAKKGCHFTTVDNSKEEQQYAKMNVKYFDFQDHVDFQISDAGHLKFEDGSFDTIFAVNVLHHLEEPYKVVDEVIRVLSAKGKVIISDFSRRGFEVVAQVHRQEGREHSRGEATINDVVGYLKEKKFLVQKNRTVFQETIVAYKRKEENR